MRVTRGGGGGPYLTCEDQKKSPVFGKKRH